MPKGRKYTPSDLMLLREEGILTPSEIRALPIQEEPDTPLRGTQIPGIGTIVPKKATKRRVGTIPQYPLRRPP